MRVKYIALLSVVLALILIIPVSAINTGTIINRGASIFVGEEGLDISNAMTDSGVQRTMIGYWASGSALDTQPLETMPVGNGKNFEVSLSMRTGSWYAYDPTNISKPGIFAFNVLDPKIGVVIRNDGVNVNEKTVTKDAVLTFDINSNLYQTQYRYNADGSPVNASNGFVNLKITSPDGATYISLESKNGSKLSTENILITSSSYKWDGNWDIGAVDLNGQKLYPAGTYIVVAESTLNNMDVNYNAIGKTVSTPASITIGTTSVILKANTESIMRNRPFSVTITGRQNAHYNLWVKDTSKMTGNTEQPPKIAESQEGVFIDDPLTANYTFQNSGGKTIGQDVPSLTGRYFANVTTSLEGTRTVQFTTSPSTESKKYTIRVEEKVNGQYKYDEIDVSVGEGSMTVVTQGYQSYYIGEVIKVSGTNTESYETYLFITGPNLYPEGTNIETLEPVDNGVRDSFHVEPVESGSWSWDISTAGIDLDAGTYTLYAIANASDRYHLGDAAYATTSITLRKPFITASIAKSTVASGDKLIITGTAEGSPNGVQIWIMGKNYLLNDIESTDSSSRFEYEVGRGITKDLANGQYFVVAQHPMQNGQFDIILRNNYVINLQLNSENTTGTQIFQIEGAGSLQGTDAAEALITALDNQNIDDTYTKLQFVIDQPFISLDSVGDRKIGDKFILTGKTNLAIDDNVQIEIYSSSFKPTQKSASGEFSGATGTVKVVKDDSNTGLNRIEFHVDTSTFKEDEYIVVAQGTEIDASGTTLFNVLGQSLVNQTVTITVTPTPIPTPVPTPVPTSSPPTPTPTKKAPGFGAIFALAGLCAVGFIIIRRK